MKQAIQLFRHETDLTPLDAYRCSECALRFDMERAGAGPRCCPICGVIYDVTREQLLDQVTRCALALNMSPTTLLFILQASLAGLKGGSVR